MARYINADLLMKEFGDFVRHSNNSDFAPVPNWNDAVSIVESAPTADVVEVVRCKECKYFDQAEKYCCDFLTAEEDGFCKWGKRRTEDMPRVIGTSPTEHLVRCGERRDNGET